MARAAQSAANRLNELESTRPRTPRGKPAMRQSPFAASARGARPHRARNRLGADPAKKSQIGKADPIYRMRSASAIAEESRFDAAESQSRVRTQLVLTRCKRFVSQSHSERLAAARAEHASITPLTVIKRGGETWIEGLRITGEFRDEDDA
jgi:hypothetical protein